MATFVRKDYKHVISFCSSSDDSRVMCLKVNVKSVNVLVFGSCFPVCDNSAQMCLLKCFTSNCQVKYDSVKKWLSYGIYFFNLTTYQFSSVKNVQAENAT